MLSTHVPTAKSMTKIRYWDVRMMSEPSKLAQVVNEMSNYKIRILGLSETHWLKSVWFASENKSNLFSGKNNNIHYQDITFMLEQRCQEYSFRMGPVNE